MTGTKGGISDEDLVHHRRDTGRVRARAAMISQDGRQPGDPRRAARAVITAMDLDPPPLRLVLGNDAFDTAVSTLRSNLAQIWGYEALSRAADFPTGK
ncbi:hypothetical protein [Nonomuraea endophytica]|uniref:Uncharacterized protein n=1 Tax=Nonomuraea endophytica TaxID=714136 RepID=A0A7W8ELF0_9ACTN|nr:hypothetical protein [Nonomuraea endophytica]MBB5083576.1 hypothetical protein [Nonomuraea endophytica]